ncbi:MAG: ATP-binding protein [Allorhizobium sp.]
MTGTARARGDVIRDAGKTTLILQILSGLLLFVLILLFADISSRFRWLQDGIRENALWSVYQLDREARALDYTLAEFRRQPAPLTVHSQELSVRYDILYSRVRLVRESRFNDYFQNDANVKRLLSDIDTSVVAYEPFFDSLSPSTIMDAAQLERLDEHLAQLSKMTEELLLYANAELSAERSDSRVMILQLEKTSGVMLLLLMASVIFLVVTLRGQLKSVREAGLSLEIMTRELSVACEAADAGNRTKSQFMATMGHEIRTPLNAILGMAELLEYCELPQDAAANVRTIRSSGEALLEVINEILDFSKIEHGKLELEKQATDVVALADSTVNIIRGRATDHGNTVVLDIPESLHALYVWTDPTRLRQVMLNLLSNAVKFTDKGTVTLRLREFYREGALMLRFEVEDTGIGIDEDGLAKLFKPFSQVDSSISRKYGGTGLGLTICKEIVEKLGGELGMSSTVDVGSIFWFELCVAAADKDEVTYQVNASDMISLPRLRVLLVEDNRVNQQVASKFLARLGQDVVVAGDGAEAVAMTETETFDLILMDMQMPVMDGIAATRQIIARGGASSGIPIVAMTANASDDDRKRCSEAGMVGFESKPITLRRLQHVIATFAKTSANGDRVEQEAAESRASDMRDDNDPFRVPLEFTYCDFDGLDSARRTELVDALGEEVFRELIDSFFFDAAELLQELHGALADNDRSHVDRVLHTIKGAAINVGLNEIAQRAHALRDDIPTPADVETLNHEIETLKFKLVA